MERHPKTHMGIRWVEQYFEKSHKGAALIECFVLGHSFVILLHYSVWICPISIKPNLSNIYRGLISPPLISWVIIISISSIEVKSLIHECQCMPYLLTVYRYTLQVFLSGSIPVWLCFGKHLSEWSIGVKHAKEWRCARETHRAATSSQIILAALVRHIHVMACHISCHPHLFLQSYLVYTYATC